MPLTLATAVSLSLTLRRLRPRGLRRRALPALGVLRRPLLSHLWLRPLRLRLRSRLLDSPARLRRRPLSNRLLTHLLLLLGACAHLLLSLRGLLCAHGGGLSVGLAARLRLLPHRGALLFARGQSLLTLGISLRLLLLTQGHALALRLLTLGHTRGSVVGRLRRHL